MSLPNLKSNHKQCQGTSKMIKTLAAVGLLLVVAETCRGDAGLPSSAADRITLRDGSIVLGVVNATTPGPRGSGGVSGPSRLGRKGPASTRPAMGPFDRCKRPPGRGRAPEEAAGLAARSSIPSRGQRSHPSVDRSRARAHFRRRSAKIRSAQRAPAAQ